jgi:hypothetical protein
LLDDTIEKTLSGLTYLELPNSTFEEIITDPKDASEPPYLKSSPENPLNKPFYALYQHLPNGDYFTSAAELSRADLKSLTKG